MLVTKRFEELYESNKLKKNIDQRVILRKLGLSEGVDASEVMFTMEKGLLWRVLILNLGFQK